MKKIKKLVRKLKPKKRKKMETSINTITINGKEYVEKSQAQAVQLDGEYVIVRTYSAGVFYGIIEKREGTEAVVRNARRIWYWSGAASLSQLAMEGTKKPNECKFPMAVSSVTLTQVIEILPLTKAAKASLDSVAVWKQ